MINNLDIVKNNNLTIKRELNWLKQMISVRFDNHFLLNGSIKQIPNAPDLTNEKSIYSKWVTENGLNDFDRLIVISCLSNVFFPEVFDKFLIKNKGLDKRFTEFSGKLDSDKSRFIPTYGTISFIYFGRNTDTVINSQHIFEKDYTLNKISAIYFSDDKNDEFKMSKIIYLNDDIIKLITLGKKYRPDYSTSFPAKLLTTELNWSDLILNPIVMDEVENVNTWIKYKDEISNDPNLSKRINKGYKCLFYGPPGTGKTLTASLIGKRNEIDIYRIDLSQVVSKYVGETEKNLAKIFDIAENKDWILFFDEAESLFSKRTSVGDSKDKFANQQTAYLLQRIEDYNGLVILATNLKPNIDRAFTRRIQSIINFPIPSFNERKVLWNKALNDISEIDEKYLNKLAKDYEISGGSIKNVVHFSWLYAKRNGGVIDYKHVIRGVKREMIKDGKTFETIIDG
ncbi:MAG: ATP-binding protein [Rickettsiales bacterium TMED289]|nr:MAG: ATP-binding protein [Rickettsiales bacterium TMED289]|tara:strand:- start:11372 stop:12736 length:1365 start_codon:yes stop_codon:yes gene_type:complete